MQRLALLTVLTLTACAGNEGETHYINEAHHFCLTVPDTYKELRFDDTHRPGSDRYALTNLAQNLSGALEIGVNDYDDIPNDHIVIEYIFEMQDDGTVTQTGRELHVPETYSYPHIAVSLFYNREKDTVYFFKMELLNNRLEDIYVDIVSSFQELD